MLFSVMAFIYLHLRTQFIGMYLFVKINKPLCELWRQIRALENKWKTRNSREHLLFTKPCIQFKSSVSWKLSHYCSSCMTSWDARSVQKDSVAPCSFWSLAETPGLPGREITMSDHGGHQAASRRHQSITSGLCWPTICHQPHPEWHQGRSLFPEPLLVFRVWVQKNAWYFTVTSSQWG